MENNDVDLCDVEEVLRSITKVKLAIPQIKIQFIQCITTTQMFNQILT